MTTISITDFSANLHTYINQVIQGEKIIIKLQGEESISLIKEKNLDKPIKNKQTKLEMLKNISYQGEISDSQNIDDILYLKG